MQRIARLTRPLHDAMTRSGALRAAVLAPVVGQPSAVQPAVAAEDAKAFADAEDVTAILPHTTRYVFRDGGALTVPVTVLWGTAERDR